MPRLRLALLVCDAPVPAVAAAHGDYHVIFTTLLQAALSQPTDFELTPYDVVKQEYPPEDASFDGVILTGSAASAYEDKPWINALVAYIATLASSKPHVKIIGICFGHQIIARALGGECVPNGGKWEVAVTPVALSPLGEQIFGVHTLNIQQMHRDHVPAVPLSFHLLGSTAITPNQGMVRFSSNTADAPIPSAPIDLHTIHILTLQGHPEFTEGIIRLLIDSRARMGVLVPEVATNALGRAGDQNDGVIVVGKVIWGVFGVKA